MIANNPKLTPRQQEVQDWWYRKADTLTTEQKDNIALAYMNHLIGSRDYEQMGNVHADMAKPKSDYSRFYQALRDELQIPEADLEFLTQEEIELGGFIGLLSHRGHLSRRIANITINMMALK